MPSTLSLFDAIAGRTSVRRFLPDPVPQAVVHDILERAARAPSGVNMQPWKVHAVAGRTLDRLVADVLDAAEAGADTPEFDYYPETWFEPYASRRKAMGLDLYGRLGLGRENKAGMRAQHLRNFKLFDAPLGLFFTMDRRLGQGSWLDMGIFIGHVLLLCRAHGLETCAQGAWAFHGGPARRILGIPDEDVLVCGVAVGFADRAAPENQLETPREPVSAFAVFHG